jgi:hypothetical protein
MTTRRSNALIFFLNLASFKFHQSGFLHLGYGLMRASYLVLLLIASSCVQHDLSPSSVDCEMSDLTLGLVEAVNASGCSSADGAIIVNASGGQPPYSFTLGDLNLPDGEFKGLTSGGYSISVTDARGCQSEINNILISAEGFSFGATVIDDTDCTAGNGSIALVMNDGTAPFLYKFMDDEPTSEATFSSLSSGNYQIIIQDANNCSATLQISVPKGETGVSWSNEIRPLVQTNCALTGCHNGLSRPDLRIYDKAKLYAADMKELTQDGSMPFEGSLTEDQIALIACWVDEGAKNN